MNTGKDVADLQQEKKQDGGGFLMNLLCPKCDLFSPKTSPSMSIDFMRGNVVDALKKLDLTISMFFYRYFHSPSDVFY